MAIPSLSIKALVGEDVSFITYEGSMSVPGCYETVTWVIINKPLTVSRQDVRLTGHLSPDLRVLVADVLTPEDHAG